MSATGGQEKRGRDSTSSSQDESRNIQTNNLSNVYDNVTSTSDSRKSRTRTRVSRKTSSRTISPQPGTSAQAILEIKHAKKGNKKKPSSSHKRLRSDSTAQRRTKQKGNPVHNEVEMNDKDNKDKSSSTKRKSRRLEQVSTDTIISDEGSSGIPSKTHKKNNKEGTELEREPTTSTPAIRDPSVMAKGGLKEYMNNLKQGDSDCDRASGIITSVRFKNFMCHENFYQEWNLNLNYVTGVNGSGKSAILAGILVGLGAKAITTSRTKSVQSLIKRGKQFAQTEITLMNYGKLDKDKYSEEIKIERTISRNGSSAYKLHTKGAWRVLRRTELDCLLMSLNIHIDSPVAILNQETSRNFFQSKDPKDKYRLFFEGTLISQLYTLCKESLQDIEIAEDNLRRYTEAVDTLKDEVERLRANNKKILELDSALQMKDRLQIELVWALVIENEDKYKEIVLRLEGEKQEENMLQGRWNQLLEKMNTLTHNQMLSTEEQMSTRTTLEKKKRALGNLRSNSIAKNKKIADANIELKIHDNEITIKRRELELAETQLKIFRFKEIEAAEAEKIERALKNEIATISKKYRALKQNADKTRDKTISVAAEINAIENKSHHLQRQIDAQKEELSISQAPYMNKCAAFGKKMVRLVGRMQAMEREFHRKPYGPLGACITVKNEKWVNLIEYTLKSHLTSFIVCDAHDARIVNSHIQYIYKTQDSHQSARQINLPSVKLNTYAQQAYDLSHGEARVDNIPTILDMIDIENDNFVIKNMLCDYARAETILLFENVLESVPVMSCMQRTGVYGITLGFHKVTASPYFGVWNLPKHKYKARYLKSNNESFIKELQSSITDLEKQFTVFRSIQEKKKQKLAELRQELSNCEPTLSDTKKMRNDVESKLRSVLVSKCIPPDIASYVEDVKKSQRELEKLEEEKVRIGTDIEELQSVLSQLSSEKVEIDKQILDLQKQISSFVEQKEEVHTERMELKKLIDKTKRDLSSVKKNKILIFKEMKLIDNKTQKMLKEANKKGDRVETKRTPKDIETELHFLKNKITETSKLTGQRKVVESQLKTLETELIKRLAYHKLYSKLLKTMKDIIEINTHIFNRYRIMKGNALAQCFYSLVVASGCTGKLLVDNENEELHYFLCPDDQSNEKIKAILARNDSKLTKKLMAEYSLGLSGGERSFATMCFIIAMWKVMHCPFYMLDEFDVYMDAFNRKKCQDALRNHAAESKGLQFFMFTPLDVTETTTSDVRILRMNPPVRSELTENPPT